jgi:hypothetical protein
MLTENRIVLARNWMFTRPDSHHHDGYSRLRRHMILAGVDLPALMPKEPCETEKFLLLVYLDCLEEFARQTREAELRRLEEASGEELAAMWMERQAA